MTRVTDHKYCSKGECNRLDLEKVVDRANTIREGVTVLYTLCLQLFSHIAIGHMVDGADHNLQKRFKLATNSTNLAIHSPLTPSIFALYRIK